jgi:hypothetical protein
MTCSVYWIRCKDHTDMFSQGYIGVSKNSERRFNQHQRKTENAHLKHAIEKYGWDNLVKTDLLISDEVYCFGVEAKLRPTEKIGWNICAGGGVLPSPTQSRSARIRLLLGKPGLMLGKNHTAETRAKMSASKSGLPAKNKGILATEAQKQKTTASVRAYSWKCLHCQKEGFGRGAATRWHFDNCKKGVTNGR